MDSISQWSFDFDRIEVDAVSTAGSPYKRRICVGVPRLPPEVLNCTFYLYQSVADAKEGSKFGGIGFFVGYPTGVRGVFPYAVTNWHVAVRDGFSVMRVNTVSGTDIFDFDASEWEFLPGQDDLAVIRPSLMLLRKDFHQVTTLNVGMFVTEADMKSLSIGAGEDIFMIGRFVDHDGKEQNVPAARFGNISTTPQIVIQPTGAKNLGSFILDVHSRTGYSGSPVFTYRTVGTDLTRLDQLLGSHFFVKLLGIHWGQFPEMWELKEGKKPRSEVTQIAGNEKYVEGMSGMTLSIPSWRIRSFLEQPKFVEERERLVETMKQNLSPVPKAESASPPATDENPTHQEDFMRLVGAAARKPAQED
jgi:hypothetical protein